MIEVKNLYFSYKEKTPILKNINFIIDKGQTALIRGPSGRGKTSLLYCLAGIIPLNIKGEFKGQVLHDGRLIEKMTVLDRSKSIGMVFQNTFGRMFLPTVEDELAFPLENLCVPRDMIKDKVDDLLEFAGLGNYRLNDPGKLSGGQMKLVALCSAIVKMPKLLLLDEIMDGLDNKSQMVVCRCIDMLKKEGCIVVIAGHNVDDKLFDREIVL